MLRQSYESRTCKVMCGLLTIRRERYDRYRTIVIIRRLVDAEKSTAAAQIVVGELAAWWAVAVCPRLSLILSIHLLSSD